VRRERLKLEFFFYNETCDNFKLLAGMNCILMENVCPRLHEMKLWLRMLCILRYMCLENLLLNYRA